MNKLDRQTRRQSENKEISKTRTEVKKRGGGELMWNEPYVFIF